MIALACVAIAFLYAGLALAGISLTLESGRIAGFWIGNALVIGLLLGRARRCRTSALTACLAANVAVNFAVGDNAPVAIGLAAANALEMVLVLYLLDRLMLRSETFETVREFAKMAAIGATVPLLSGVVAAAVYSTFADDVFWHAYTMWLAAHCLPIPIFGSMVLIARNAVANPEQWTRVSASRWGIVLAAMAIGVPAIFAQTTFPFLFLAAPVVVVAAFLTGRLGTAITVAVFACAASIASMNDMGPIALIEDSPRSEIIALQVFLASLLAIGIPVAVALANRATIREELRQGQEFVNSILEGIGDIVFRLDPEWNFTYLNRRWEHLSKGANVSLLRNALLEQIVGNERDRLAEQRADPNLVPLQDERHTIAIAIDEKRTITLAVTLVPQFDEDGAFSGMLGSASDVTESLAHRHELAESEARFRRLAESAPVGIFQADAWGDLTYVNSVWLANFGLKAEDVLGDGWKTQLATGEEYEGDPAFSGFNKPGDVRRRVIGYKTADGEEIILEIVNSAEFDANGDIVGYVGIAHDITRQQRTRAKLEEREQQLALLADNATDAVLRLSLDGLCLYASPSSQKVFGVPSSSLVGLQFLTGFHPDDAGRVKKAFRALSEGDESLTRIAFRAIALDRPGEYQWLEAQCGLLRDKESGDPLEMIVSLRNIDETKALEAALVEARDRAEGAVEAKSAFLANMSHEIRTPMNGVIGFTELALSGEPDPERRQNLEMIADSGRSMLRLLNDLLDFAKIESGQMTMASEPTDLRHKLRGAVRLMEPVAIGNGLSLDFTVDDDVPKWFLCDPIRLRQIILNLLGNALKFTEEGAVEVTARLGDDPATLQISVTDSGIGIAPDKIDYVFENFTQADSTIARRFGGTGLGLPICAQLASLLGGKLEVESQIGKGSTFTLTLPVIACEAPEAAEETGGDNLLEEETAAALRILVAEDNPINQHLTIAMLEKLGCSAILAHDGREAVDMAVRAAGAGNPFDIVLMDMQMPVMDGLEATRAIRAAGLPSAELPIIALTANAYQEDIDACLKAGMQEHIAKPLRMRELGASLNRWALADDSEEDDEYGRETDPHLVAMYDERKTNARTAIEAAIRSGTLEGASLDELAAQLHQIAGIAAYFGEEALGEESRRLENALLSGSQSDQLELFDEMRRLLAA